MSVHDWPKAPPQLRVALVLFFFLFFPETKTAVTDPNTEGIQYIDEKVDGENNIIDRDEETRSDVSDEDSDRESEEDPSALHINRVNLSKDSRQNDLQRLRVCVEIRHPALKVPVYRTWTGKKTAHGGHTQDGLLT